MKVIRILFTPPLAFFLVLNLFLIVYVADLKATIMTPAFVEKELVENFYPAIREELGDRISEELTNQLGEEEAQRVSNAIKDAITHEWAEITTHNIITGVYDYLNSPESSTLNLVIPLSAEFKSGLKNAIGEYFTSAATGLSEEQVNVGLRAINQQVDNLPDEFTLTIENLDPSPVQHAIAIFNHFFAILIALAVLLAVLLILLHFKLKSATRVLGFCSFISGAISLAVALVVTQLLPGVIDRGADLPSSIDFDMVTSLIRDLLHPAVIYSIILLVLGVALIVFSFLWREKAKVVISSEAA